jgi:mannitol/fructose-specific phosphotransferase system IIA component (Ntr-type)
MKLSEIIIPKRINLNLKSTTKDGVLEELVKLLNLDPHARETILQTLRAREELGSTGIGKGVAIPHCRSLVVSKFVVAVGRSKAGVSFKSIDNRKAFLFFLIVAPPVGDPPGDYLIALGTVAQWARLLARDKRFKKLRDIRQFMKLVEELEE